MSPLGQPGLRTRVAWAVPEVVGPTEKLFVSERVQKPGIGWAMLRPALASGRRLRLPLILAVFLSILVGTSTLAGSVLPEEVPSSSGYIYLATSTGHPASSAVHSYSKPTAVGIGPAPGSSNDGIVPWNTTLIATWSGGTPPFVVTWDFGDGTANVTESSVVRDEATASHEYTTVGKFTARARVTDSMANSSLSNAEPIESAAPLTVEVAVSPNSISVGSSVTLWANVSGGLPPYLYSWSGLPESSCPTLTVRTVSCSVTSAGTYTVSVRVTDSFQDKANNSSTLVVRSPVASGLSSLWLWTSLLVVVAAAGILAVWAVWRSRAARTRSTGESISSPPKSPPST